LNALLGILLDAGGRGARLLHLPPLLNPLLPLLDGLLPLLNA
jgi:hypothetical protein